MNALKKIRTSPRSRIFLVLYLCAAAFIVSMQSPMNPFYTTLGGVDSSVFHYVASVIEQGGLPYRDTFDHKGPLLYLINYLGLKISYYSGAWLLEYFTLVLWNALTYRTARLFCGRLASCAVVFFSGAALFSCFFGGNFPEVYALPCITGALYIFTDYFLHQKISPLRLFLCGAALAGALMLKPNTIAVWVVFSLAVLVQAIREKNLSVIPRFLGFFLLGFVVVLLPFLLYFVRNGIFTDFIDTYFRFNFLYAGAEGDSSTLKVVVNFLFCEWAFPSLVLAALLFRQKTEERFFWGAYLLFLLLSVAFCGMSGNEYVYYRISMLPCYALPLAAFLRGVRFDLRRESFQLLAAAMAAVFALCWYTPTVKALGLLKLTSSEVHLGDEHHQAIFELIEENTTPDDRILVYGNEDSFYFYSHRFAASKYSFQYPIVLIDEDIRNEFFQQIAENHPKLIIVQSLWCDDEYIKAFLQSHPEYVCITDFSDYAVYQYSGA